MRHPKFVSRCLLSLTALSLLAAAGWCVLGRGARAQAPRPGRRVRIEPTAFRQAPTLSFDGATEWINSAPIQASDLRGKIVLLDFWTYCCINCHHILPDLAKLEQKYKNELVVIGVHSPKFFAERDTENIRQKVHEYQIKHPVLNDADQLIWTRYGVNSWPTLALFDADGSFLGGLSGEGHYAALDQAIGRLVARHQAKGDLNTAPFVFFPESDKPDNSGLSYPGKVLADEKGKRLFIADTAHNRIVQTGLDGGKPVVMGSGAAGLADGDYAKAQFNRPQGMCLMGETLYVADTENHALRAVDLKSKQVSTVAGNGQQSRRRTGATPAAKATLNSPWDVIQIPGTDSLAIAMAGIHEIWRYDLNSGMIGVWAGTGVENILDGAVTSANFAQPSGLATDGQFLYVADSEVSAIRAISLEKRRHVVRTIVGQGLFVFDDVDGQGPEVRLQHCLGVAYGDGRLFIADSYNNKIKVCDPKTAAVETFVGSRQPGKSDAPPRFYQPGGLSVAGGKLYVADTNNSQIRVVDLKEKTVATLDISGLKPPAPPRRQPVFPNAAVVDVKPIRVAPGKTLTFNVTVPVEEGYKLSPEVAMPYLVETPEKEGILAADSTGGQKLEPPKRNEFDIKIDLARPARPGDKFPVRLSVATFVCSEKSKVCRIKNYVWNIPVTVANDGMERVVIEP